MMNAVCQRRIEACTTCVVVMSLAVFPGCDGRRSMVRQLSQYYATHESARSRLPIAVQIEELFPGETDHFISHFAMAKNSGEEKLMWNSVAYFDGRFELQMQIPVMVDYDKRTVTRAGEPIFGLMEIARVEDRKGQTATSSRNGAIIGEAEWNKIYQIGGDFSIVKIDTKNTAPSKF